MIGTSLFHFTNKDDRQTGFLDAFYVHRKKGRLACIFMFCKEIVYVNGTIIIVLAVGRLVC